MKYIVASALFLLSWGITHSQESEINAFDPEFAALFGYDVAVDGEYAVVGAPLHGGFGSNNAGAAYIFQLIGGIWTYVKKLTPPWGGYPGDQFGYSVDISLGYVIIGAIKTDHYGLTDVGSAYIYEGSGSSWFLTATLHPSDGSSYDHFGNSVGISGVHAIVGAADDDPAGAASGSAYIFEDYHGYGWVEINKITASNAGPGDAFGTDVSISGDYAVVGAPANVGVDHKYSGSVYVFKRWGNYWVEDARLVHDDADFFDHLGESVDIVGTRIIAGAPFAADKTGAAYIFALSGNSWQQEDKLEASDGESFDKFGHAVGITDGFAAVGAFRDDDAGTDAGAMYIFEQTGTVWSELVKHTASDGAAGDLFGWRVDIDGDYAISGAPYHSETTTSDGGAYLFGPSLAAACQNTMYLTGILASGHYQAADHTIVDGQLMPATQVDISSANYIELQAGFEAHQGSILEIDLGGCQ